MTTWDILKKTRAAWPSIRNRDAEGKNALLRAMADSLMACAPAILAENRRDMEEARGTISDVMLDRLYLDEKRLAGMAEGIRALTALPDHTGRILSQIWVLPRRKRIWRTITSWVSTWKDSPEIITPCASPKEYGKTGKTAADRI